MHITVQLVCLLWNGCERANAASINLHLLWNYSSSKTWILFCGPIQFPLTQKTTHLCNEPNIKSICLE